MDYAKSWYDCQWTKEVSRLDAAMFCIRQGGRWKDASGKMMGADLFTLYRDVQSILWPEDDHHEWSDLVLRTILESRITAICGPKDSSKTRSVAKFLLIDYLAFPEITMVIVSSTQMRSLELRIWGDIKTLYNRAKEVWLDIPGNVVDSLHGIFTDALGEGIVEARDLRRGIICVPVKDAEGKWQGMDRWVGLKQKRRRIVGDECQWYANAFLSTLSNLDKGDFKGIFIGNPLGEGDPLDKLSEPEDGWGSEGEITKTTTWKNRWDGITVQLYGPDSPAVRHPGKYPYLTNQEDIDRIIKRYGKESAEHWMQGLGIRPQGMSTRRVVTREMAAHFGAQEEVVWRGTQLVSVLGLDAAYGGDACIAIPAKFGMDINGTQVLASEEPILIPIRLYPRSVPEEERLLPEDQIATRVREECERRGIPPANVFFDSTGRGSLGTSFARLWSADVNPVESGGNPSERPVCSDMYIIDDKTGQRRLVRANEYYSKRVTEFWFSVRYAIEGRQIRQLPVSVLDELASREWTIVRGNKRELETKDETKERLGRSPDRADAYCITLEGARRLGFNINGLESGENSPRLDFRWKRSFEDRVNRLKRNFGLLPTK